MARGSKTALYLNDPVKWIAGVLSLRQAAAFGCVAVLTYVLVTTTSRLPYGHGLVGQVHLLLVAGVPTLLAVLSWALLDKGAVENYPRQVVGYLLRSLHALPSRSFATARHLRATNRARSVQTPTRSLPLLAPALHLRARRRSQTAVRDARTEEGDGHSPSPLFPSVRATDAAARGAALETDRREKVSPSRRWTFPQERARVLSARAHQEMTRLQERRTRDRTLLADDGLLTVPGVGARVWLDVTEAPLLFTYTGEAQDRFTAQFASLLTLPLGYSLQISVLSTPLPPGDALDDAFAEVRPATAALADLAARLRAWWEDHLKGQYVPRHRFLVVVRGPLRATGHAAGTSLEQVADETQRALRRMGVTTRRLGGSAVRALLDAYPAGDATETIDGVQQAVAPGVAPTWYARSFYLIVPPLTTDPGFLAALLGFPAPLRLALHVTGLDQERERTVAKRRSRSLADVAIASAVRGRETDVDAAAAHGEARTQALRMRAAGAAVVRVGLYITVFAPDKEALDARADALWSLLTSSGGVDAKCARARGHQEPLAAATQPLGLDPARSTYRMEAETCANAWPIIARSPGTGSGILVGRGVDGALVRLHIGDRSLKNRLIDVFGGSGQGKSFWAQIIMTWFLLRDAWATAVDTVGGYETLCQIADGRTVRLGGPRTAALNVWEGATATEEERATRAYVVSRAHEVLLAETGGGLSGRVRAVIDAGVSAVYAGYRAPAGEEAPRTSAVPLERDLAAWLEEKARRADDHEDRRLYKEIAADLAPYVRQGRYAPLVDRPTSFPLDTRLLAFHIDPRDLPAATPIYAFVMFLMTTVADQRDALAQTAGRASGGGTVQHLLAIDEGWAILHHQAGQDWVAGIGRTGRHSGIVPMFVSQKLSDLTSNTAAAGYFDQTSLHFVFNMHDTNDESGVDPRAWIARKLRLTESESARIEELQGEAGRYAQMFMVRTTKHAAQSARGVVNVASIPEFLWLFASDPDDKEMRARMVRAVAADPDQPTSADIWAAICRLAAGERPTAGEQRTAPVESIAPGDARVAEEEKKEAALWLVS